MPLHTILTGVYTSPGFIVNVTGRRTVRTVFFQRHIQHDYRMQHKLSGTLLLVINYITTVFIYNTVPPLSFNKIYSKLTQSKLQALYMKYLNFI